MKEVKEVLRQKELDLARVANEVHALQVVAPLLVPENEVDHSEGSNIGRLGWFLTTGHEY